MHALHEDPVRVLCRCERGESEGGGGEDAEDDLEDMVVKERSLARQKEMKCSIGQGRYSRVEMVDGHGEAAE